MSCRATRAIRRTFHKNLGRLQPTAEVYHRSLTQADKADIAQTHSHAWIRVMLAAPLLSVLSLSYLGKFVWTAWGQDPCFLCIFPVPWQGGIDGWMLFGVMERNRQTRRMYSNMHWWHSVWIKRELDLPVEFGSTEERMLLHPASLAKHIAHRNLNLAWVFCVCLLCVWVCSRIEVCVVQQMFWTCSSIFGLLMPRIHSQRSYLDLIYLAFVCIFTFAWALLLTCGGRTKAGKVSAFLRPDHVAWLDIFVVDINSWWVSKVQRRQLTIHSWSLWSSFQVDCFPYIRMMKEFEGCVWDLCPFNFNCWCSPRWRRRKPLWCW